jgi:class 3 adenylate cyclase/tetratricopeptide (TPR) repeat protein
MSLRSGMWAVCFTDLVGSTEQRARLGDHVGDALRREHDSIVALAASQRGGIVVKGTGDGAMVAFPASADAVDAAVAFQQGVERRNHGGDEPLALRVGISAGDLVYEADDLHGLAANEAARLCALADPGQILIGDLARAMGGSRITHQLEKHGDFELKGIPDPVRVWTVTWTPAPEPTGPPFPAMLASPDAMAFTGRVAQMQRLQDAWTEAAAGEVRAVFVSGEPGIGKTRLAAEVARIAHDAGALVLYGRCGDQLSVPFQPFAEILEWYLDHAESVIVGEQPGHLARLSPRVADRVPAPPPASSDPETEQYRLFGAVASWLTELSTVLPVLVVLDDLHWATQPTLLMLRHLLQTVESARLLVVVTFRDTDLDGDSPLGPRFFDFARLSNVQRLSLEGLDLPNVASLVASDGEAAVSTDVEAFVSSLVDDTGGNPFFIGEVLRHLVATGLLTERDSRFALHGTVGAFEIPDGVKEMLRQRFRLLGDSAVEVLAAAAVVGREFDFETLLATSGASESVVVDVLESAASARLIEEAAPDRYRFAHALVEATLLGDTLSARRFRLHRRVAEHLEVSRPGEFSTLAHHWIEAGPAGDRAKAVHCSIAAGQIAAERRAYREACEHFGRAAELDDGQVLTPLERCDLLIDLGSTRHWSGEADFRDCVLDAARLARELGDRDRIVRAAFALDRGNTAIWGSIDNQLVEIWEGALEALGNDATAERARLLAILARELMYAPLERRDPLCDEALSIATKLDEPYVLVDVSHPVVACGWGRATTMATVNTILDRVATSELDPGRRYTCAVVRRHVSMLAGDFERAHLASAEANRLVNETPWPYRLFILQVVDAGDAYTQGLLEDAERLGQQAFDFGQAAGQPDAAFLYGALLGLIRRDQGRSDEVIELFLNFVAEWRDRPGLPHVHACTAFLGAETDRTSEARRLVKHEAARDFAAPEFNPSSVEYLTLLADACATLGMTEEGAELYERIAPHHEEVTYDSIFVIGTVAHTLGRLARLLGRQEEATHHLRHAEQLAERMGAPLFVARARADRASLALAAGNSLQAQQLVQSAVRIATTHNAAGVELYARAALAAG